MSQEGVDKLRRGYEVLNREGVDAALNLGFIDPDIVVRASQDLPDTDIYRGHDGMRRLLGMFFETFDRSEEHTSNSSHLVISYAVFCLKKKKHYQNNGNDFLRTLYGNLQADERRETV